MDDVPSRSVESSRSEREAAGRGFYDLGTDFTVLHREIARGVQDAVGKRCTRDDFLDVLQKVSIAGWDKWRARPGCPDVHSRAKSHVTAPDYVKSR